MNLRMGPRRVAAAAASPYLTGLTHYYSLDEAGGIRSDLIGTAHFADVNTVLSSAGVNNLAAAFVKTNNEYLSLAGGIDTFTGTAHTVSLWVYRDLSAVAEIIWSGSATTGFSQQMGANGALDTFQSSAWNTYAIADLIPLAAWTHLLIAYDGSLAEDQRSKLYVNATLKTRTGGSGVIPVSTVTQTPFEMGRYTGGGYQWNGLIDEFGVWSRTLSQTDATYLYNSGAGKFYPSF
jgi:hypothetical protein